MKLVDLTRRLDATDIDRMPEQWRPFSQVLVPQVEHLRPAVEGADIMCLLFDCTRDDLPDGEGWADDRVVMASHIGTHVDAPLHSGTTCEGRPARTIDQIGLEELFVDSVVLDVRADAVPGEAIPVDALRAAVDRVGGIPEGGGALVRTGQERYTLADEGFYVYPGMSRDGTLYLAECGARVLGTDALGWDRPFGAMREAFERTGDPGELWDGHYAVRDREAFIVQQLTNLAALPERPVRIGFFPINLAGCSAAPARVVAFVDQDGTA